MKDPIDLFVPASCAHLGPGFGVLGLAIDRGLTIHATPQGKNGEHEVVRVGGETGPQLTGRLDPIVRGLEAAADQLRLTPPPLRIEVRADVPLGVGLGSDAAAHVAGARLATLAARREDVADEDLLQAVVSQGADPVHAAASLTGGLLSLMSRHPQPGFRIQRYPIHPLWSMVVTHPARSHAPIDSARMLPATLPHAVTPRTSGRVVGLLRALIEGDATLTREAMQDEVHVPYRRRMVEGMTEAMAAAVRAGAAAATICGHGPGVIAFVLRDDETERVGQAMRGAFEAAGTPASSLLLRPLESEGPGTSG